MRGSRILALLMLMALAAPARAGEALSVVGIRYGMTGGKTRIVVDFNAKPDFRLFLIDGPPRLALDLPPVRWKIPQSGMATEEAVRGYRSGALEKDGLTRVIFDLRGLQAVDRAFVIPKSQTGRDRIVIDLSPASRNLFAARTKETYGNPALRGAPGSAPPASATAAARNAQVAAVRPPAAPADQPRPEKIYTVVIDPGHGGEDPGALGSGAKEKHITLEVARELKRQLDETGRYNAVLTRRDDRYIRLRERVAFSRKVGADLFISVHADKIGRKNVRGASIYTLSETASDAETERLAEGENAAGVVAGVDLREESQDVADILLDLAMREKMNEFNFLARVVADGFRRKNVELLPNSHRSAGFAVLKAPDVPAILIETGFLSNPEEAKLLKSSAFQRKIAAAILDGVDAYFRKIQALNKAR